MVEDYELDWLDTFGDGSPELDFVLPGLLAGTVGTLVAPNSTGKSYFALEAAVSIACDGVDLLRLGLNRWGKVGILCAEDPAAVLRHRLNAIGKLLSIWQRIEADANFDLVVKDPEAPSWDLTEKGTLDRFTAWGEGKRLIILDTLSRFHSKDGKSNAEMVHVMGALELLAARTGAAVLFLHTERDASVLRNLTPYWSTSLSNMSTSEARTLTEAGSGKAVGESRRQYYVRLSLPELDYSELVGDRWYKRAEGGVLVPVELSVAQMSI